MGRPDAGVMLHKRTVTCFVLGIIVSAFVLQWYQSRSYSVDIWSAVAGAGVCGLLIACVWRQIGIDVIAASLGIALSLWTVARTTPIPYPVSIDAYADDRRVAIEGLVTQRPEKISTRTTYTVDVRFLEMNGKRFPMRGRMLVRDRGGWPVVPYGGFLRAEGKLERPSAASDFRYDLFLSASGVRAMLFTNTVQLLPGEDGNPILGTLMSLRGRVEGTVQTLFGEPHASLLAGLLTGARREMPEDLQTRLSVTGLTHLVAISGFNITLLLTLLGHALFFLPFRWRLIPGIVAVTAFTLFVGGSASVVRASVMGILGLIAAHAGRQADRRLVTLWALAIMILWNPRQFWYDPGFHLSFLALAGIAEVAPLLDPLAKYIPETLGLREALRLSLASQITTAPWSAYLFGQISLIAPVSNLLAPPLVPMAMLFGALSVLGAGISSTLGMFLGALTYPELQGILWTAEWLSVIPYASVNVRLPVSGMIVIYTALALAVLWWQHSTLQDQT